MGMIPDLKWYHIVLLWVFGIIFNIIALPYLIGNKLLRFDMFWYANFLHWMGADQLTPYDVWFKEKKK